MLQSVWSRLRGSRSLLPARDLFDADLDRARRKPGCALCRLILRTRSANDAQFFVGILYRPSHRAENQ